MLPGVSSDAESSASLYTGAESNLGDRVLGEVEKDSFITLPGKGGEHNRVVPQVLCLTPWGIGRGLIVGARGQGYVIRIKAVTVLHSSDWLVVR